MATTYGTIKPRSGAVQLSRLAYLGVIAGAAGKDATDRVLPLAAKVLRMKSRNTVAR